MRRRIRQQNKPQRFAVRPFSNCRFQWLHCSTAYMHSQYGGCWWPDACQAPRHLQPAWWHRPVGVYQQSAWGRSPKVVDLFSATNICSNIVWLLQLQDTTPTKSHFGTKFSSIYLAKWEKPLVFRVSFVNLQRAKDGTHVFDAKYRYVFVV